MEKGKSLAIITALTGMSWAGGASTAAGSCLGYLEGRLGCRQHAKASAGPGVFPSTFRGSFPPGLLPPTRLSVVSQQSDWTVVLP